MDLHGAHCSVNCHAEGSESSEDSMKTSESQFQAPASSCFFGSQSDRIVFLYFLRCLGFNHTFRQMRALVLFKGIGSVDRSLEAHGFKVDSLDMVKKFDATWTSDILNWEEWRSIEPGTYDFIWASPPCTQYSCARTTAKTPRNLELADSIVTRTLLIIWYLAPKGWLMENPATGLLKTREIVAGIPFRDVCYCKYSDGIRHKYRKPTRLWGHLPGFEPRPTCAGENRCEFFQDRKHPCSAQRFDQIRREIKFTLQDLYSMPQALTDDIAKAASLLSSYDGDLV